MDIHTCSECNLTSKWASSIRRHFYRKHLDEKTDVAPKEIPTASKEIPIAPKEIPTAPKEIPDLIDDNRCNKCEKILSRHTILLKHQEKCKGKINKLECMHCHEKFTNSTNKYRHQKNCKAKDQQLILTENKSDAVPTQIQTQNIETQQNIQTQNNNNTQNNNITINVLKFPEEGEDFDFLRDHIDKDMFKKLWDQQNLELGFRKFTHAILDRAENRIVKKSNLNTKFSSIHQGDNKWEVALDRNVFPLLTHQMSCAALECSHEYKKKRINLMRTDIERILEYLDNVNVENDQYFNNALEDIRVLVHNMTIGWETKNIIE